MYIFIWIISFFAFLADKPDLSTYRISGYAQGTTYQITYYASESLVSKRQTDSILLKIDSSLSIYKPYSLISRFNDSAKDLEIDVHFQAVVSKALEIYRKTDGAFDITVKPLVQAWGFGVTRQPAIPDSAEINTLLECTGSEKIHLRKNLLLKDRSCIQIDVNGIAQGYTVDQLADLLEREGIKNYLVELGGEIRVKGKKPDGSVMAIGIESPPENNSQSPVQEVIYVPGGAITTSGNYRKFYQQGNKQISHLIDPKTGYPVQNELISVTVWAQDAMTADGYDNALMGMGLERAMSFVKKEKNLEAHFIYRKDDGSITDTATPGFYKLKRNNKLTHHETK